MNEAGKPGMVDPMVAALGSPAEDMLSTFAFLILFAVFHNVLPATSVAIVVGVGQDLRAKLKDWAIELMRWLSVGLVVVLEGATLFTRNLHLTADLFRAVSRRRAGASSAASALPA